MKLDHERIWLQPGAGDCGETTWCQDRVHDDDIEYVRKDIHDAALLDAHQRGRREGMEEAAALLRDHATISNGEALDPAVPEILAFIRAKSQ